MGMPKCTSTAKAAFLFGAWLAAGFCQVNAQGRDLDSGRSTRSTTSIDNIDLSRFLAERRGGDRKSFWLTASPATPIRSRFGTAVATLALNLQVLGGGTVGRLTKWTGFASNNSLIGDTAIFEDKNGNVGIGTEAPAGKLTVAGTVQSTSGGFKFPDGSVQTTSASGSLSGVAHDESLIGDGTPAMPVGIAPGGVTNVDLAIGSVAAPNISAGQVVKSLNGAKDDLSILGGENVTVVPVVTAGTAPVITGLIISAPDVITSVAHDTSLAGNGAGGSPLGVALPLSLSGSTSGSGSALVTVRNSASGNNGIEGIGGTAGAGIVGSGGDINSDIGQGGPGVFAGGGDNSGNGIGGPGLLAVPGNFFSNGKRLGLAGDFRGDVAIAGTITKTSGSFKIDHPLEPSNKYLYHSFVESPDMKNIYDGIAALDAAGEATVELPEWFGALNRDFRYQLTCIGGFAPVYIAAKIANNRFRIAGGLPGMEVSWQVTGIRQDPWANAHRIPVEENKSEAERGYYLHPELFGQSAEKAIEWAQNPQLMQRLKERKETDQEPRARNQ
jgi:hypothetical protein